MCLGLISGSIFADLILIFCIIIMNTRNLTLFFVSRIDMISNNTKI